MITSKIYSIIGSDTCYGEKKIELPKEIGMVSFGNRVVRESTSEKVTFEKNLKEEKKPTR